MLTKEDFLNAAYRIENSPFYPELKSQREKENRG